MLVETNALTKRFGPIRALTDCSMRAEPGEVLGLLGPNGAGKTTLLRVLLGFLKPSSGWARIDGLDCYRKSVHVHRRVAYLPGEVRLFRNMRGRDLLSFMQRVRPGGNAQRSRLLAARLELDVSRRVPFMSTGMRQKLALAATLAADTPLLILDEPTSNLDPNMRGQVLAMVDEARREGRTVLFSSHVLSEVEQVCDRVIILRDGRLVHTQVMGQLRRRHRIRARINGPVPPLPESLAEHATIEASDESNITIETPDELSPILGYLATLPVTKMTVEPVGLRAVYDQYHEPSPLE